MSGGARTLGKERQLEVNRTLPGAPAMRAGRMSWITAQAEAFRGSVPVMDLRRGKRETKRKPASELERERRGMIWGADRRLSGPFSERVDFAAVAAGPGTDGDEWVRPVTLDSSKLMVKRRAKPDRAVLSVISFAGWSEEDLAPVRRCVRKWGAGVVERFGFSPGDVARLKGA